MAGVEFHGGNIQNLSESPVPSAILPQYSEMILTALDALNEKEGSNKSAISKQIEDTYGNLPPAHSTLLTHHLNRMKSAGQLVFLKNNYMKPDPDAPPRRGRGRPPKAKPHLPAAEAPTPSRPRGRPPKTRDPNAPPSSPKPKATGAALSGKKRGRPPKASTAASPPPPAPAAASGAPRGRGRPPKVKPAAATAPVGA